MSDFAGAGWIDELREAVGEPTDAAELDVEGLGLIARCSPIDGEAFGRGLALLSEKRGTALIHGSGTQMSLGNVVRHVDVALSTKHLSCVDTFDPQDGVLHAGGGTRLADLRKLVNAEGWEIPLDPPFEGQGTTLGGVLSTAAIGPRRLGFGAPRDCVLGLDVVLASGERTRCGGRVVKNVTGYDLAKLYTGAFGTLGLIEGAWLRLRPLPEDVAQRCVDVANAEKGIRLGVGLARRYSARAVMLLSPGLARRVAGEAESEVSSWRLYAEFAGDVPAVEHDVAWFESESRELGGLAALQSGIDSIGRIGKLQSDDLDSRGLRARIAVLPSRLEHLVAALRQAGAELVIHPGLGLVYANFEGRELDASIEAVDRAVQESSGSVFFETMPSLTKSQHDVFRASEPSLTLMRALKRRFDAAGVLNPGRYAGGI